MRYTLVLLLFVGCVEEKAKEDMTAHVSVVFAKPTEVAPPQPTPPSSECKNCKGKGKVGDGRTMVTCAVCDGKGVVTTMMAWPPKPTVTMCTRPNCPPCEKWKAQEAPKWEAQGWTVQYEEVTEGTTPWFKVLTKEGEFHVYEYLTSDTFKKARN
jgi:hypothetical protein